MGEVVARMRELATHRGDEQRRNRRDRAALKSTFRELITTVEVCSCPKWVGTSNIGSTAPSESSSPPWTCAAFPHSLAPTVQIQNHACVCVWDRHQCLVLTLLTAYSSERLRPAHRADLPFTAYCRL